MSASVPANGTAVFYDPVKRQTVRVPENDIIMLRNQ
jgi:hypothetical protein